MLHNYESLDDPEKERCGEEQAFEGAEGQLTPPLQPIKLELMEAFNSVGIEEALTILHSNTEKPCVTSVTGHAAYGRVLAASVNIGAREYLLKRTTKLGNGVQFDPSKLSISSYNDFLSHFTLYEGSQINSHDIGMLLATGCGEHALPVYRRISPVILSYGDSVYCSWESENAEMGNNSYDYLRPQLMSFMKEMNFDPIDGGILRKTYQSIVEGLIHGFLYSSLAAIVCHDYEKNLPSLLNTLINEFRFEVLFKTVEGLDVIFAHAVIEDQRRYVFILSDQPRVVLTASILLLVPLLHSLSGTAANKMASVKLPVDLPLGPSATFLFSSLQIMEESNGEPVIKVLSIENIKNPQESIQFFDRDPVPRESNALLQLPASKNSSSQLVLAGTPVPCVIFASTSAKCKKSGCHNPNNCSTYVCPHGYGGNLCTQRPSGCGFTTNAKTTKTSVKVEVAESGAPISDIFEYCI